MSQEAHIFISYARQDSEFALRLASDLRSEGVEIWLDQLDIPPGVRWDRAIEQSLRTCDRLLIILSPASVASENVMDEVAFAFGQEKQIVPVLHRRCEIPLRLLRLQYIDFTSDYDQGLTELLEELQGAEAPEMTEAVAPPRAKPKAPPTKPFPWRAVAFGAAALLVVVVGIFLAQYFGPRSTPPPTTVATATTTLPVATPTSKQTTASPPPTPTPMPTMDIASVQATQTVVSAPEDIVFVPAGEFIMGSPEGEGYDNEDPQHTVYLDAFYISKYEVTNAEYKKCVDAGACDPPSKNSSSIRDSYYGNPEYDNYPVIWVSWYDAQAYCEWKGKRLPTEAEREKAARGTDGREYPWGNSVPGGNKANYCDVNCGRVSEKDSSVDDGYADTAPVGSYEAGKSPYGAYDMAGNVWEWVADWYDADYYSKSPERNPQGPNSGLYRVLRGGSGFSNLSYARCASRAWYDPGIRSPNSGFRCAASPGSP